MLRSDKKLGISKQKHTYDIPFHKDTGAGILITVIAVMGILVGAILLSGIIVHEKTKHWVTGVDNLVTIDIPAIDKNGKALDNDVIMQVKNTVQNLPFVQSITLKDSRAVAQMLSPWLGANAVYNANILPIPTLLSVTLKDTATLDNNEQLVKTVDAIHPAITIEVHARWTRSIHRVLTIVYSAIAIALVVIIAVAALVMMIALSMRLMIYKKDIELLHLMGARNRYIARQFMRHAAFMMIKGLGIATLLSAIIAWTAFYLTQASGLATFAIGLCISYAVLCGIIIFNTKCIVQKYLNKIGI